MAAPALAAPALAAPALAGGLLGSLLLMGLSRKIFSKAAVERHLVPHRADIGIATFLGIGINAGVALGLLGAELGPGGAMRYMPSCAQQLGYLFSLIARNDLPPAHPTRLLLLLIVWVGLGTGGAWLQVVLEVASLWVVKLTVTAGGGETPAAGPQEGAAAPFIKPTRRAKSPGNGKQRGSPKPKPKPKTGGALKRDKKK